MAKAMLIFEDTEDGAVTVKAEFSPPIKKIDQLTGAQQIVMGMCCEAKATIKDLIKSGKVKYDA